MVKTTIPVAFTLLMVTGCAQHPPDAPPGPATVAEPTPQAQVSAGVWDVDHVRCSDLLHASDDDRAAAAMFYYGYLAARSQIHVIDVTKIDGNIAKVMSECSAAPNITVPQAFRRTIGHK